MEASDTVLGGRVSLAQPPAGYRAAIDPILLAACCPAGNGQMVLDAGCGVGTAGLCVAERTGCDVDGIELQDHMAALARLNLVANGVAGRVFTGSIMHPPGDVAQLRYDHVLCNPPYLPAGYGSAPDAAETHEGEAKLADWVRFCARRVAPGGSMIFIHRADRLPELLAELSAQLGAVAIFPLWPRVGEAARRVIVGGIRGRNTPPRLLAGLTLHESDGRYTSQAQAILGDAEPIQLWPA